jgi:hypothetical protein
MDRPTTRRYSVVLSPYDRQRIRDINAGGPRCCTYHQALSVRGGLSRDAFSNVRYLNDLRQRRGGYCLTPDEGR